MSQRTKKIPKTSDLAEAAIARKCRLVLFFSNFCFEWYIFFASSA